LSEQNNLCRLLRQRAGQLQLLEIIRFIRLPETELLQLPLLALVRLIATKLNMWLLLVAVLVEMVLVAVAVVVLVDIDHRLLERILEAGHPQNLG
jgi:hypothetical protein